MKRCKKWYTQPITIRWSGENNPKKQIPGGGQNSTREKKLGNPWNSTRENFSSTREENGEKTKKAPVKQIFHPWRKSKKWAKNSFHGGKKNSDVT